VHHGSIGKNATPSFQKTTIQKNEDQHSFRKRKLRHLKASKPVQSYDGDEINNQDTFGVCLSCCEFVDTFKLDLEYSTKIFQL